MKSEINPATGQPDPARTLLNFFPELSSNLDAKKTEVPNFNKEDSLIDDLKWNQKILKMSEAEKDKLIEEMRSKGKKKQPESEMAQKVLEIIKSANKYPISFESVRKSRKWGDSTPDNATILASLEELKPEWIRGNEKEGYYLQV